MSDSAPTVGIDDQALDLDELGNMAVVEDRPLDLDELNQMTFADGIASIVKGGGEDDPTDESDPPPVRFPAFDRPPPPTSPKARRPTWPLNVVAVTLLLLASGMDRSLQDLQRKNPRGAWTLSRLVVDFLWLSFLAVAIVIVVLAVQRRRERKP